MSKIMKIFLPTCLKKTTNCMKKSVKQKTQMFSNVYNNSMLSKSMMFMGVLGATVINSCESIDFIGNKIQNDIDDSVFFSDVSKNLDGVLSNLGLLISPNKSITDLNNFSFKSDKAENFYLKLADLKDDYIELKQIKFNSQGEREDATIFVTTVKNGIEVDKQSESSNIKALFLIDNNEINIYKYENGVWLENYISKKGEQGFEIKEIATGKVVKYYNVINNGIFPDDIFFEHPEEIDDGVIF